MVELEEIKKFLDEQDNILAPIQKALSLSYWYAALSGKKQDYDTYVNNMQTNQAHADPSNRSIHNELR